MAYTLHLIMVLIMIVMGGVFLRISTLRPGWFVKYMRIRGKYEYAGEGPIYILIAIFFIAGGIIFFFSK
jgi:hypothetical protein